MLQIITALDRWREARRPAFWNSLLLPAVCLNLALCKGNTLECKLSNPEVYFYFYLVFMKQKFLIIT